MKQYRLAALGGTFDRLHDGHKALIKKAFSISDQIIIGITSDSFLKTHSNKEFSSQIQEFTIRKKYLQDYLKSNYEKHSYSIVPLNDPYGPILDDKNIQSLVIGPKTLVSSRKINRIRSKNNLPSIKIIKSDFIKSKDGRYLSSTRIRKGIINRKGLLYKDLFSKDIRLKENFRAFLQKMHGPVITPKQLKAQTKESQKVIWVGDYVGKLFIENNLFYDLGIFDLKTRREKNPFFQKIANKKETLRIQNRPGIISKSMAQHLKKALSDNSKHIYVFGEEDLAVIPLVLSLPIGSIVCYGLHNHGMIMINVTEDKKEEIYNQLILNDR